MDNLGITNYGTLDRTYASGLESSANNSSSTTSSSSSTLDMNDFLTLLAAQFENQDITDPTDNTEFISEMAQFSSLEAMTELSQYAERQYASSLVGKTVTVSAYDSSKGTYTTKEGVVKSASISSDGCSVIMSVSGEDTAYDISSVTSVSQDDSTSSSDTTTGEES